MSESNVYVTGVLVSRPVLAAPYGVLQYSIFCKAVRASCCDHAIDIAEPELLDQLVGLDWVVEECEAWHIDRETIEEFHKDRRRMALEHQIFDLALFGVMVYVCTGDEEWELRCMPFPAKTDYAAEAVCTGFLMQEEVRVHAVRAVRIPNEFCPYVHP